MKRYHVKDGGWGYEADDGLWVDYDDAMAEIDALKAEVSKLCAELTDAGAKELALHNQLLSAEAELAALKAPPQVLSAEEVVEPGIYIVRDIDRGNRLSARHIDCVDIDIGVNLGYEYIGPLRLPEEV